MRTAFVQFKHDGTEYSFECHYEISGLGEVDNIEAKCVAVGDDQLPPASDVPYWGPLWHDFHNALREADAENYPTISRDDGINSDTRI